MKLWKNQPPKELGEHKPNAPVGEMTTAQALTMFQRALKLSPDMRFHALDGAISNLQRSVDNYRTKGGPAELVTEAFCEVEGLVQAILLGA